MEAKGVKVKGNRRLSHIAGGGRSVSRSEAAAFVSRRPEERSACAVANLTSVLRSQPRRNLQPFVLYSSFMSSSVQLQVALASRRRRRRRRCALLTSSA